MNRTFSETEMNEVIQISMEVQTNMLKYICKENFDCRYAIKRHFRTIIQHNIVPEHYWHGNSSEFEWLLVLLSDNYPGKQELLTLALTKTNDKVKNIADYFYQHINVMFDYVKRYAGYDILRPSEYMLRLYPHASGKLYVYTSDKWNHNEVSSIEKAFMMIDQTQVDELPKLISVKIRGY